MARVIEIVTEYESQEPCKTADQMEDICCEPTAELLCCEVSNGTWGGYTASELLAEHHPDLDANGRDSSDRYVVIELQPRKNVCGEKVTEYDISGGNCCDEVVDMSWDEDNCVDLLPDNSSGTVSVFDGSGQYVWKTPSAGFFLDAALTKKQLTTTSRAVTVYTSAAACGTLALTVSDGCTRLEKIILAEDGQWVQQSATCDMSGLRPDLSDYTGMWNSNQITTTLISGDLKIEERIQRTEYYRWPPLCTEADYISINPDNCFTKAEIDAVGGCDEKQTEWWCDQGQIADSTCFDYPAKWHNPNDYPLRGLGNCGDEDSPLYAYGGVSSGYCQYYIGTQEFNLWGLKMSWTASYLTTVWVKTYKWAC